MENSSCLLMENYDNGKAYCWLKVIGICQEQYFKGSCQEKSVWFLIFLLSGAFRGILLIFDIDGKI
jgi:hypothetical protein